MTRSFCGLETSSGWNRNCSRVWQQTYAAGYAWMRMFYLILCPLVSDLSSLSVYSSVCIKPNISLFTILSCCVTAREEFSVNISFFFPCVLSRFEGELRWVTTGWKTEARLAAGAKDSSCNHWGQPGSGTHPSNRHRGSLSRGKARQEREADYSPPRSVEFKNE